MCFSLIFVLKHQTYGLRDFFVVLSQPSTDSTNPGASGSSPGSPVDDNLSVSSCSTGEDSSDEASSTLAEGVSSENGNNQRVLSKKLSSSPKIIDNKPGINKTEGLTQ